MNNKLRVDWTNSTFMILSPMIATLGLSYMVYVGQLMWQTFVLFMVLSVVAGVSITAGYHRLFSHKSYETSPLVKALFLFFGAGAFENSALKWSSDHRDHHRYVDTERDPYNINKGFIWAHIGWIFFKGNRDMSNVKDLASDPLVRFQDKYIISIGATSGFLFPVLLGMLWGDALGAFILAGWLRIVLNHHFTFFINSLCHMIGSQPYSDKNTARDSAVCALLTYGEGYHNFHHAFQYDFRNGYEKYQWDPSKWLILGLEKIGMASSLKRASEAVILRSRLDMQMKKITSNTPTGEVSLRIQELRHKLEKNFEKYEALKAEYREYRKNKKKAMRHMLIGYKTNVKIMKSRLEQAKWEFKESAYAWNGLLLQQFPGQL